MQARTSWGGGNGSRSDMSSSTPLLLRTTSGDGQFANQSRNCAPLPGNQDKPNDSDLDDLL